MDSSSKPESTDSSSERKIESQSRPATQITTSSASSSATGFISSGHGSTETLAHTPIPNTNQRRTPSPPKRNSTPSQDVSTTSSTTETIGASTSDSGQELAAGTGVNKKLVFPSESPASTVTTSPIKPGITTSTSQSSYTQHYKVGSMVVALKRSSSDMQQSSQQQHSITNPEFMGSGTNPRTQVHGSLPDSNAGGSDPKRKKIRRDYKSEIPAVDNLTGTASRGRGSSKQTKVTFAGISGTGRISMTGNVEEKMVFFAAGSPGTTSTTATGTSTSLSSGSSLSGSIALGSGSASSSGSDKSLFSTGLASSGTSGGNDAISPSVLPQEKSDHTNLSSTSNTGSGWNGAGLKVPPIKIVLQSHAHGQGGSNLSNMNSESENSNGRQDGHNHGHGHGHLPGSGGFPYVVSSTTVESSCGNNGGNDGSKDHQPGSSPAVTSSDTVTYSGTATSVSSTGAATPIPPSTLLSTIASASLSTTSTTSVSTIPTTVSGASIPVASVPVSQSSVVEAPVHRTLKSAGERKGLPAVAVTVSLSGHSQQFVGPSAAAQKEDKDKQGIKDGAKGSSTSSGASLTTNVSVTAAMTTNSSSNNLTSTTSSSTAVVVATAETSGLEESTTSTTQPQPGKEREKPHRVTRSSQRIATHGHGHGHGSHSSSPVVASSSTPATSNASSLAPNSPANGNSPKTSACPSPSNTDIGDSSTAVLNQAKSEPVEKMDTTENTSTVPSVDVHPRRRKLKSKESATAGSSSSSTSGDPIEPSAPAPGQSQGEQPVLNCFEMFLNIRKQIDRRRKNMFPVQPKPPQGFKDYLMNRGTYVLANTANARLAVPFLNPPQALGSVQLKELFIEQEKHRHKLRLQHLVEKEKLVLSVEQEILRVHGRAARALSNQSVPFSVCTILKDQEVYNLLTPEQEEKDRNARSRYNGRLFISWLQDVDDKWDKIKESMLLRHHNESESLHAVQKMDWEWKLKEVGLCEPKSSAVIDEHHVPMVHVSDDFDLLPG